MAFALFCYQESASRADAQIDNAAEQPPHKMNLQIEKTNRIFSKKGEKKLDKPFHL